MSPSIHFSYSLPRAPAAEEVAHMIGELGGEAIVVGADMGKVQQAGGAGRWRGQETRRRWPLCGCGCGCGCGQGHGIFLKTSEGNWAGSAVI